MTVIPPPSLGSVIWAELEDANGFRKFRPAVVVSPSESIAAGEPIYVVAVTTRLPTSLPSDYVLLPWDRQGKAHSGLRKRCAAVTSWQAVINIREVKQVVGILPNAHIDEILLKLVPSRSTDAAIDSGSDSSD